MEIIRSGGRSNATVDAKLAQQLATAETIAGGAKIVGRVAVGVGVAVDGYSLYSEVKQSQQTGSWNNTQREASRIAGGWTGAWAGGQAGASVDASIGAFGGPIGATVGGDYRQGWRCDAFSL